MKNEESSHSDGGLLGLLTRPRAYALFRSLVGKRHTQLRIVQEYIRPFPGCRILEIGCGTASILSDLPDSIGEYVGFDMNPAYVEFASKLWKDRADRRFFCQKVEDVASVETGSYDIVLALAIVHHLSDSEADRLFDIAFQALRPNGALITYDNVYVEDQHWFAKWLISRDRGRSVRTADGYRQLAAHHFADIEGDVLHDALRVPYTVFIMRCIKRGTTQNDSPGHSRRPARTVAGPERVKS